MKNVVVVEARRIGWGASGRNAGFVAKGYSAGEAELAAKVGLARAQGLVTLTKRARLLIRKRIEEFNIDCGPLNPGVLTASRRDRPEELKRYIDRANENFDLGFEFWPREKLRTHCRTEKYFDGVFSPHDFQFDPLRYLHGIAKGFVEKGGRIFEESPAVKIEKAGADWIVRTAGGSVKAADVVVCCAAYSRGLDRRLENAVFPVQTYITVTEPLDENILSSAVNTQHAIAETHFVSNYYRRLPGNRLLWGGRVGLFSHPADIADAMLHDMFEIYPQLKGHVKPETAWAGLLAYAPHKMPQVGYFEDGYWFNTGFGGHGLCPTTACGEVVAAAIAEGDRTFLQFQPFRPFFTGGRAGRYAAQMVYLWWRLRDRLGV